MSTGNDLVFLPATQPERTRLPRFYSRILTTAELAAYDRTMSAHLAFDHYVWLCWSIKESVYKYQKREAPGLVFAPLQIAVREIVPPGETSGFFGSKAEHLHARTLIRDGVISTVVCEDAHFTGIYWDFSAIGSSSYTEQSTSVRKLVLEKLRALLSHGGLPHDDLQLQKDAGGCPILFSGDRRLDIPVSLAHHDRYIAYSFRLSSNKVA